MNKVILTAALLSLAFSASAQQQVNPATQPTNPATLPTNPATLPADSTQADSLRSYELGEVTVTSQRQIVKNEIDKLSYDVQADEDAKSKSLMEMLRKVPMVTVDGQDNVKIKGSSTFKIYRNGHRDPSFEGSNLATILKSIPANTLKRIEVITDPGAKEDAEGTTYILNLVMLDNARFGGIAGSLSATASAPTGEANGNVYLTSKVGRLTFTTSYGLAAFTPKSQSNSSSADYLYNNGQRLTSSSRQRDVKGLFHFGNLSASYEVDSLNLATLSFGGQALTPRHLDDWEFYGNTALTGTDGQTVYAYDTSAGIQQFEQFSYYGRFDFEHKTHLDGEALTFSYMLNANGNTNGTHYAFLNMQGQSFGYDAMEQFSKTRFTEHTLQLDYIWPLGQHHKLEVGAKYIGRVSKSDTRNDYAGAEENNMSSLFRHTTDVGGAYAQWMFSLGRWSARAGLRYELSRLAASYPDGSAEGFHRTLSDWVPSASLRYAFDDNNSLKLGFSTSINRPGIGYLNPARTETPTTISYGNASLKSSRVTSVWLDFTHVGQKLTWNISPYYGRSDKAIAAVEFLEAGKQVTTYAGVDSGFSSGFTGYAEWTPFEGTQVSFNGCAFYNKMENNQLPMQLGAWMASGDLSLSQKLPWKLHLTLGGGGSMGRQLDGVYSYGANWHYHYASLQRSFLKDDRLTLRLSTNNPIGPMHRSYTSRRVQGDYTGTSVLTNPYQKDFGLTVVWRFGKLKASVKSVGKTIENSDLKSGKSGGLSL